MTIRAAYEKLLGYKLRDGENSILCFCHDDKANSCSLNTINGLWVCHATGNSGNLAKAMHMHMGIDLKEAYKLVQESGIDTTVKAAAKEEKPPIPTQVRDGYIRELNHDKAALSYARKSLGWNPETVKEYEIGYSAKVKRYTIPVYDGEGQLRNFRMYDPHNNGTRKMISWGQEGYGTARLFPVSSLTEKSLILCEGEKDCILTNQYIKRYCQQSGWAAITGTGGASSWSESWNESFRDKDVYIIYDRDKAGEENAPRIAAKLAKVARLVKVVRLDISEPPGADITNYFMDSGKSWDDLHKLIEEADAFTPQTKRKKAARDRDDTVHKPHLAEASDSFFVNKRLQMKVLVAGKELAPFALPQKITFDCEPGSQGQMCDGCSMMQNNGLIEHEVKKDDPFVMELIRIPTDEAMRKIKAVLGIVAKCRAVNAEVEEHLNVEEVTLVPEIDFSSVDHEYVSRTAYVAKHGVRTNQSSVAIGTTLPHPKTGQVVHFLDDLKPAQSSVEAFKMDEQKLNALMVFQPKKGQSVGEKFDEIARDLSLNVTKIYGREDLVRGIDLCYHTVLNWHFQGKLVGKGWGDVLIIGDTRTGKTETVQALIYHYKLGEMSLGENTSFAGLVGGLKQGANRQWSITWGKIPLNNKRLLVIDEMSGLALETIGDMSGIRSNGVAEMTKIETQRTMAQTRLLWLSNPRDDKSMSQYGHGVEAIKHLVGRPEDIARFDFVLTAATNEVPIEEINSDDHDEVDHVYTSDLCRNLILWAWSRNVDQVYFTDDAVKKILELAIEQSKRYASSGGIPLVEGGNHRIKLAKLAVAAACRTFSTEDGETVIVTPEHAQFAADFLDDCYGKPSLDYAGWSITKLASTQVPQETLDEAEEWCKDHPDYSELWLTKNDLRLDDFKTQFGLETKEAKDDIFVPLTKMRMIEKGRSSNYVPSPAFIQILKRVVRDEPVGVASSSSKDADFPF